MDEEDVEKAPWYEKYIRIFLGVLIICISILFFIFRIMPEKIEPEEHVPQRNTALVSYLGANEEILELGGIIPMPKGGTMVF